MNPLPLMCFVFVALIGHVSSQVAVEWTAVDVPGFAKSTATENAENAWVSDDYSGSVYKYHQGTSVGPYFFQSPPIAISTSSDYASDNTIVVLSDGSAQRFNQGFWSTLTNIPSDPVVHVSVGDNYRYAFVDSNGDVSVYNFGNSYMIQDTIKLSKVAVTVDLINFYGITQAGVFCMYFGYWQEMPGTPVLVDIHVSVRWNEDIVFAVDTNGDAWRFHTNTFEWEAVTKPDGAVLKSLSQAADTLWASDQDGHLYRGTW